MKKFTATAAPVVAILYAEPGMGKTTLAGTAPGPCALIDTDRGAHRANHTFLPEDTFRPDSYDEFRAWVKNLKRGEYKTIIVDTLGALIEDYMTPWVAKMNPKATRSDGQLSMQGWGAIKGEFKSLFATLKGLDINIVFIAHAKDLDEGGRTFDVPGGASSIVKRSADLIGYLTRTAGQTTIDFRPIEGKTGKGVPGLDVVVVPPIDDPDFRNFLASIFQTYHRHLEKVAEASRRAAEQLFNQKLKFQSMTLDKLCKLHPNKQELALWADAIVSKLVDILEEDVDLPAIDYVTQLLQALEALPKEAKLAVWNKTKDAASRIGAEWDKDSKTWKIACDEEE